MNNSKSQSLPTPGTRFVSVDFLFLEGLDCYLEKFHEKYVSNKSQKAVKYFHVSGLLTEKYRRSFQMVVMNYYLPFFKMFFVTFFILEVQRFHCRLSTKRLCVLDRLDEKL